MPIALVAMEEAPKKPTRKSEAGLACNRAPLDKRNPQFSVIEYGKSQYLKKDPNGLMPSQRKVRKGALKRFFKNPYKPNQDKEKQLHRESLAKLKESKERVATWNAINQKLEQELQAAKDKEEAEKAATNKKTGWFGR